MLVLADRLLVGAGLWQAMAATGAELVWRVKCATKNAPRWGSTGCWGRLLAEPQLRPQRPPPAPHPITVRVIEDTPADPAGVPAPTATGW